MCTSNNTYLRKRIGARFWIDLGWILHNFHGFKMDLGTDAWMMDGWMDAWVDEWIFDGWIDD